MQLHLVGGFLGSGKTTSIIAAAKLFMAQNKRVGIITNDQGKFLVDTGFFQLADFPAVEVTGGCFCCNYGELDSRLNELVDTVRPDVVFAESVGSCADLVATVIKPLLELRTENLQPSSFSVFADSRLLRLRLLGEPMPFTDNICYIFDQQIEEAGILVINKTDLLSRSRLDELMGLVGQRYSAKTILTQSAIAPSGVTKWFDLLSGVHLPPIPKNSVDMDYQRYGAGEAKLAWLDQKVVFHLDPLQNGSQLVLSLTTELLENLKHKNAPIGHLKILASSDTGDFCKVSITTLEDSQWQDQITRLDGSRLEILINARVEMEAIALQTIINDLLVNFPFINILSDAEAFHPAQPQPTYRFA